MSGPGSAVELWVSGGYELAEGARWVEDRLVFVDILSGRLHECTGPGTVHTLAALDVPLGAVAPLAASPGGWIVAAGTGIALLDGTGNLDWLARPLDDADIPSRMNDGVCDPAGRFWAGSMAYDGTPGAGSLYRVDTDLSVTRVLDGMGIVNGPAFSADGDLMYVTDTAARTIYRCTLDTDSGTITSRGEFVTVPSADGSPDGMCVDTDGRIWVALWDGAAVRCYNPDGVLHREVALPALRPTSICLSGPTGGDMFVTTARHGLTGAGPESGAVLHFTVEAVGQPARNFVPDAARRSVDPDDLSGALALAESVAWSDRARAGRWLAGFAGDPEVDQALRILLTDRYDTGVVQQTAIALLSRRDDAGLRLVVEAHVDCQWEVGQTLFEAVCAVRVRSASDRVAVRRELAAIGENADERVQQEITALLDLI